MIGRRRATLLAVAAVALAAAAAPPSAGAAAGLEIGIEDERLLLDEPERADDAVAAWAAIGVDVVRIHARWGHVAPGESRTRRPSGFNPADHRDPGYDWAELDHAIGAVRRGGLRVMLTVTGPGPVWTSRVPSLHDGRYKPDPRAFAAFTTAVARRYGDDVERYLIWNEPNIPGWLSPQRECRGSGRKRRCDPLAPHIYRGLVQAATPAIRRADPGAEVLVGELAPVGRRGASRSSTVPPLPFLRSMACVRENWRPMRGGHCSRFKPIVADALGHHPHGVLQGPLERSRDRTWAKLADLPRLIKVLDRLTRMRRLRRPSPYGGRLDLHFTEFGYQTSPPDHAIGIPASRSAVWNQQAMYLAWRSPRVRSLVHYQWEDEPVRYRGRGLPAYAGWQSGLKYVNGRPKPELSGFVTPFVADRRRGSSRVRLWGQARVGAPWPVRLMKRSRGGGSWSTVATVQTALDGSWSRTVPLDTRAEYRFAWGDGADSSGVLRIGSGRLSAAAPGPA